MSSAARGGIAPESAFGDVLRDFRHRRGLSQERLAFDCGLSREYISLLERGKNLPSVRTLLALADALDTQASDIFHAFEARLGR